MAKLAVVAVLARTVSPGPVAEERHRHRWKQPRGGTGDGKDGKSPHSYYPLVMSK